MSADDTGSLNQRRHDALRASQKHRPSPPPTGRRTYTMQLTVEVTGEADSTVQVFGKLAAHLCEAGVLHVDTPQGQVALRVTGAVTDAQDRDIAVDTCRRVESASLADEDMEVSVQVPPEGIRDGQWRLAALLGEAEGMGEQ